MQGKGEPQPTIMAGRVPPLPVRGGTKTLNNQRSAHTPASCLWSRWCQRTGPRLAEVDVVPWVLTFDGADSARGATAVHARRGRAARPSTDVHARTPAAVCSACRRGAT